MNKTKVTISGERQKVMQKAAKNDHVVSAVEVLAIIEYSVPDVRNIKQEM